MGKTAGETPALHYWKQGVQNASRLRRLQIERGGASVPAGDDQFAGKCRRARAPAQGLSSGNARDVGIVVVFGEVREDHEARVRVECFRVSQKFADRMI